ncbi:Ankyrin-2 [Holothuria leucospilota]|uniref:Ankyrin-2 n=1 Tax=Holothuria leucospilota TaxID=206669 RepID=A0A9Q0YH39_HOLLE|nr:Ankyrin-2 [Holothuria leucospilota]
MSSSLRIGVAPSESFTIEKDASEGKENGPATDKVDDKPSKPQKPSKLRTDDDGKPSMDNIDLDEFREAAIKAGYEDVANYYAKKTDGNASFLRAARAGNLDKVLEYLKGSTDINTSNAVSIYRF